MNNIAVFGNCSQPRHRIDAIVDFFKLLDSSDFIVSVDRSFMEYLIQLAPSISRFQMFDNIPGKCDVALSLGGDGTFLSTARAIGLVGIPVAGINTGHLGFLADVDIADGERLLKALSTGDYRTELRSVLTASIIEGPGKIDAEAFALNEIAILRHETASMIEVKTVINDTPLADFRGDGLIVSTPTGSTGYNLSVGGPIIEPSSSALSVAPIAPHSLSMRPVVVADTAVIDISIESRANSWRLSLDGQWITLPVQTKVRIVKAPFSIKIIHTAGHTFASTLRSKLLWGAATF